ncbi:Nn.00g052200.m01.CDS01 [Neocucurbitaria sp. VM-36]
MSHSTTAHLHEPTARSTWTALPGQDNTELDTLATPVSTTRDPGLDQSSTTTSRIQRPGSVLPVHLPSPFGQSVQNLERDALLDGNDPNDSQDSQGLTTAHLKSSTRTVSRLDDLSIDDQQLPRTWLPYTLRRAFLGPMIVISLTLAIALAVLCWYSVQYDGLGKDDESAGLLVVRRYLPTILAVFFTQALVMISDGIKQTEPFARLARHDEIDHKHTLLYKPRAWWSTLREGFTRDRNAGRIGWILVLSSLATGLSLLAISTLSSSLLATEQVLLWSSPNLRRFAPSNDGSINLTPSRQTYFHTASSFLFNASTSMWVSDSHVVLPYGPSNLEQYADFLPEGEWEAESRVFQMESECVPMTFGEFNAANRTYVFEWDTLKTTFTTAEPNNETLLHNNTSPSILQGFNLRSDDGCQIQLYASTGRQMHRVVADGGLLWTNLSSSHVDWDKFVENRGIPPFLRFSEWMPQDDGIMIEFSEQCLDRNLLLVTTPWATTPSLPKTYWQSFQARAELCTPAYYEGTALVNASISSEARKVAFDEIEFKNRRRKLSEDHLDLRYLEDLTFRGNKLGYLTRASVLKGNWAFEGLTESMVALYSFNTSSMLSDANFASQASRLRSRFFGELMLSSVTEQQVPVLENVPGQSTLFEQRIVVVTETAVTLSVLLLLLCLYLCYIFWGVAVRHRPLSLSLDPGTTFGTAAYLQNSISLSEKQRLAAQTDVVRSQEMSQVGSVSDSDSSLKGPAVTTRSLTDMRTRKISLPKDWRPTLLRTRLLSALLLAFALVAVALIVLKHFADRQQLYRSAFLYQVDFGIFRAKFSPHSVIATLVAVGVALWWDAVDKNMRVLQPYLSMSKEPVDFKRGAAVSYQSVYWLWASVKAAMNRHWLLCLVTVGTTLCQVLIVSMAAIFERNAGTFSTSTVIDRTQVIRVEPLHYNHTKITSDREFFQDTMKTVTSDWLYSALDQLTLQAEQPAWSRDGWSFSPVDLNMLPDSPTHKPSRASNKHNNDSQLLASAVNITLTTSALRGRLQCDIIPTEDSSWFTENEVDLFEKENSTGARDLRERLNRTGYILPQTVFNNTTYQTSIYSRKSTVVCCSNETDPAGRSAVGYWSHTNPDQWWNNDPDGGFSAWTGFGPQTWPPNFAIKWIAGTTVISNVTAYSNNVPSYYKVLQFREIPDMSFLNCKPVVEKSDAKITVARSSGQVLEYELSGEPEAQEDAWSAHFDPVDGNGKLNISQTANFTAKVSYGSYFLTQMLVASSIAPFVTYIGYYPPFDFENLDDERFNIRDKSRGLNMDLMSYSNLFQAGMDPLALLDPEKLLDYSQNTFQTFFQHYASQTKWTDGKMMAYEEISDGPDTKVEVVVTERIETLTMVPSATWLSLAIIFILLLILVTLIASLKVVYPRTIMQRNVESLADVLALIEGSHELLGYAKTYDIKELERSGLKTKLGWFRDGTGIVRWGIEVVDAERVEWVGKPEMMATRELAKSVVRSMG